MNVLKRSGVVALAALLCGANPALAATPDSGTISPSSTSLTYTFPPSPTTNVSGSTEDLYTCNNGPDDPCDIFTLTIEFPADFASTHPNDGVRISASTDSTASDIDLQLADDGGKVIFNKRDNPPDQPTIEFLPGSNTHRALQVQVIPGSPHEGGSVTIELVTFDAPPPTLPPPLNNDGTAQPPPPALPPPAPGEPRYLQQQSPSGIGDSTGGEMNIGYNPITGRYMLLADLQTMRMTVAEHLDDPVEPPLKLPESCAGLWEDVSYPPTTVQTGDPILTTDPQTGRTFVSQLTGSPTGDSIYAFSDDDGDNWTQGTATNDGALDHQSMVSGPYAAGQGPSPASTYPNVVNYCSQSLPNGVIGCVRSDDGGLTFGAPIVAALNTRDCSTEFQFIHGHIRYTPDGTIYIPVNNCDGHQALLVSSDSGNTYTMRPNLNATPPNGFMHSAIAPSLDGSTLYHCYVNANGEVHVSVSHDQAATWTDDANISTPIGLAQGVFVAAVAGDADRASCGFLATTSQGNYAALDFPGIWYGYMATTHDAGKTWRTIISTPKNPVQGVGGVCTLGTTACLNANRNLLDFNEMVMDQRGYPLYAYDDGCTGGCDVDPINAVTYVAKAAVVRQIGGKGLLSSSDGSEPAAPHRTCLDGSRNAVAASLFWKAPDHGGEAISGYRIYRGASAASVSEIAQIESTTHYTDTTADPAATYYYKVAALNGAGEALKSNAILLEPSDLLPETVCAVPGVTQLRDAEGDETQTPPGFEDQYDIQNVSIAEPGAGAHAGKLVVILKVAGFSAPPASGTRWVLRFNGPTAPPEGQDDFFIAMTTENGATPGFVYGTTGVTSGPGGAGARTFTIAGDLDAGSAYSEDGTILLVVDKNNSLFGPLRPGDNLFKMFPSIRAVATPNNNAIYDQGDEFIYTLSAAGACAGNQAYPSGSGVVLGAIGPLMLLGGFAALGLRGRRRIGVSRKHA